MRRLAQLTITLSGYRIKVKAKDLQTGDALQNDKEETVTSNHIEHREINVKVYNFEVEGFDTYFVSDLGILVHNICKLQPFEDAQGLHTVFKFDNETGQIRSYKKLHPLKGIEFLVISH